MTHLELNHSKLWNWCRTEKAIVLIAFCGNNVKMGELSSRCWYDTVQHNFYQKYFWSGRSHVACTVDVIAPCDKPCFMLLGLFVAHRKFKFQICVTSLKQWASTSSLAIKWHVLVGSLIQFHIPWNRWPRMLAVDMFLVLLMSIS